MPLCPEGPVSHVGCPVVQQLAKLPPGAALAISCLFPKPVWRRAHCGQPLSPLETTISLQMLLMMKAGPLLPEQICAFCQPWQSEMETQRSVNGP